MGRPRLKRQNEVLEQFFAEMERSGYTPRTLAPVARMNAKTFSSWGRHSQPHIDQFDQVVRLIGCRLRIVPITENRS